MRSLPKVAAAVFALALIAGTTFTGVKQSTAANSSGSKGTIALSLKTTRTMISRKLWRMP